MGIIERSAQLVWVLFVVEVRFVGHPRWSKIELMTTRKTEDIEGGELHDATLCKIHVHVISALAIVGFEHAEIRREAQKGIEVVLGITTAISLEGLNDAQKRYSSAI